MSIQDTLISARMAKALRARQDRNNAYWDSCNPNVELTQWRSLSAEQVKAMPRNARMTNEQRGKLEQFEVWRDKPEQLTAYAKLTDIAHNPSSHTMRNVSRGVGVTVTTWPGNPLGYGYVTSLESWRSNFGDMRAAFYVVIAGERYHGIMTDANDLVTLRKAKH